MSSVGFRLTTWAVASFLIICAVSIPFPFWFTSLLYILPLGCATIAALVAVAGLIIGFVGRCRCLATPPEFATARTRIRLAVILEGCGWLSGVANLAVAVANSLLVLRLPGDVLKTTTALSFLLLVAGRMMFLWYTRSLADAAGNNSLACLAARSLVLFIAVAVSVVIGGVPIFTVSAISSPGTSTAMTFAVGFGAGLWFAACGVGVYGLIVYARLLRQLPDAAAELVSHTPAAEDATTEGAP